MIRLDRIGFYVENNDPAIKRIQKTIDSVFDSFIWEHTTEGQDYWAGVINNLKAYKRQIEAAQQETDDA